MTDGRADRRTDRRTDISALAYTSACIACSALLCYRAGKKVKISLNRTTDSCVSDPYRCYIIVCIKPNRAYTPPTPTRHNCRVASRRRRRCEHNSQLAHDDCRRIRSTVWKLNIAVWYVNFDRYWLFQQWRHYVVTCHQQHRNKLDHDSRRVRSHRRRDSTRLNSRRRCVLGIKCYLIMYTA